MNDLLTPYIPTLHTRAEKEWWHFTPLKLFTNVDVRTQKAITKGFSPKLSNNTLLHGTQTITAPAGHTLLVECPHGEGAETFFTDHKTITVEPEGELTHLRLVEGCNTTRVRQQVTVEVQENATYTQVTLVRHAGVTRTESTVDLTAHNACANIHTLHLTGGQNHHDNTLQINHLAPNTHSTVAHKNVVTEAGHGIFQGCFYVAPQAGQITAHMHCDTLLEGEKARTSHRPALEILADDVQCSHGASTGQLDEEALFYMQARGIAETTAKAILTQAFIETWHMNLDPYAQEIVAEWLS